MIDLPTPALIGVVHLPALPASPAHLLPMSEIVARSVADARALGEAGFDALIIENLGDAPFTSGTLSPASVAAMAVVADHVRRAVDLPIGINALRNDAIAALSIAAATGATFVRVNVHVGVAATDQGFIEGTADRTLRFRKQLGRRIAILADVHVKHATPISEQDIGRSAKDTAYRGLADGLIVTGVATGEAVNHEQLEEVRTAVPDRRLFVGSGATVDNVSALLKIAGGAIVGTWLKVDGKVDHAIDVERAKRFVQAARNR